MTQRKSKRNTTIARISFFTHAPVNNRIDVFDPFALPSNGPSRSALVGFDYSKTLSGGQAAEVTINLKPRKEAFDTFGQQGRLWTELLEEGDWWQIEIHKNGEKSLLSFGKIDDVSFTVTVDGSGTPINVIAVTGRGFGYGPSDTPVFFNPYDPEIDNARGINMMQILDRASGTPDQVVQTIVRGFMGGLTKPIILGGYIEVPRGIARFPDTPWIELLNDLPAFLGGGVQSDLRGGILLTDLINPETNGNVWELAQSWCNPMLNEVFIDTLPSSGLSFSLPQAKLVVREKPFVNLLDTKASPWFKLTSWDLDTRLLKSCSLSRGKNRINYIMVTGDLKPVFQGNALGVYKPLANRSSIKRHGLKRLEESTSYVDGGSIGVLGQAAQLSFLASYRQWLFLILSWNMLNHKYWQGTLSNGEMRPEIRVGEKIFLKNAHLAGIDGFPSVLKQPGFDPTFYVEAVSHRYMAGQSPVAETTVTVSRGFVEDLRVIDMSFEATNWTVVDTIPAGSANSPTAPIGVTDLLEQITLSGIVFDETALINFDPNTPDGIVIE